VFVMQHTSFGPTPFTNVRTPFSDAIDICQGGSGGYDKPAYAGSKLSGTRHGGVVIGSPRKIDPINGH